MPTPREIAQSYSKRYLRNGEFMLLADAIEAAIMADRSDRIDRIAGLTPRQREALNFIQSYSDERGYSPNYREIADGLGLAATSGVNRLVKGLVARGYIAAMPGRRYRSIAIRAEA